MDRLAGGVWIAHAATCPPLARIYFLFDAPDYGISRRPSVPCPTDAVLLFLPVRAIKLRAVRFQPDQGRLGVTFTGLEFLTDRVSRW